MGIRSRLFTFASQTFSNPTFTGTITGAPQTLAQAAIPFISLSSGSVAANGAISAITALPAAYANAYCYFPANILATVKAAGWYYCTFSTTTAGTAFLDTYTSGTPTIPSSPTAVTDGKGAFTGDTGEEFGPTITVPGGRIGANGSIEIFNLWSASPANANAKTPRVRFDGQAGTIFFNQAMASQTAGSSLTQIANRGSAAKQVGHNSLSASFGVVGGGVTPTFATANTAVDTTVVFSLQKAVATDNVVLERFLIRVDSGA